MLLVATLGFAITTLKNNGTFENYSLKKIISKKKVYPYLNSSEKNLDYMKIFLSKRPREIIGPGASTLGYVRYYMKKGCY